jgi:hypothetical protein
LAKRKAPELAKFNLHLFERDLLIAFAHMQAERTPLNDARTERWLKIAGAIQAGRPLAHDPTMQEYE